MKPTQSTLLEDNRTTETTSPLVPIDTALLANMQVVLEARLGETRMTVAQLMELKAGNVIELERSIADHVDIYLNSALVARGEIVAVGEMFGVRITELSPAA
jgi:flagellar motor switch protein FliN/FliY